MTPTMTYAQVRDYLLARQEIALLDVREEDPYAQAHPLWAANLPLSHLELAAWRRIPRRDTLIVVYGSYAQTDLAPLAAERLRALGYTRVHLLAGGLAAWQDAGGEVFRDVNVPSKAFGELVEHERQTPSLSAPEVKALLDAQADMVVFDVRRFDEYQTMNIPTSTSVPGAELVLRARALAPNPATRIVVNCAGRTRSIIGTQSLRNAGIPNPVAALRNGTIGWTLAGQALDHGAARRAPAPDADSLALAQDGARAVAEKAGVLRIALQALPTLATAGRSVYHFDVRSPEEFAAGHLPGFASAPGGQLVQETDHHVAVRGARIVLADDDGVRAAMSASWLAQMGWEVYVLDPVPAAAFSVRGAAVEPYPAAPEAAQLTPQALARWQAHSPENYALIDVSTSANYVKKHIPGAWFAIRAQLAQALALIPAAPRYVLSCGGGLLAAYAVQDLRAALAGQGRDAEVYVLTGGNAAWFAAGLPEEAGEQRLAVPRTDRYRRPYEGTDAPAAAMQAYLDWEFGLVAQLRRDGTHHFRVL